MRIAVSGTHRIGKSTLIEEFVKLHPSYLYVPEPYHAMEADDIDFSQELTSECITSQLSYSIDQLNSHDAGNIIFDRCPVDFIAYFMCLADDENFDIEESAIVDLFDEARKAISTLDIIIFLPLDEQSQFLVLLDEEENYRKRVNANFEKIYRDDSFDLFSNNFNLKIIELSGPAEEKLKKLERIVCDSPESI